MSGVPRSGTSLCCRLAGNLPDTVALSEPIRRKAFGGMETPAGACERIGEFALQVRTQILVERRAPSVQVEGCLDDNRSAARYTEAGLRRLYGAWGEIAIEKALSPRFNLLVKHNLAILESESRIAKMNAGLIPRDLRTRVEDRLRAFPAVALLGPRQVGKTTLARVIADAEGGREQGTRTKGIYLDLESPADQERLADPQGYLGTVRDRLVVLDEIHRAPRLFQTLRGIIDDRIRGGEPAGQFLLLGSASMDLLRQSGESLAGRIAYLELGPLDLREVSDAVGKHLWVRGGFPRSLLASSDADSAIWRENFIRTYLERDVPALGPRIPAQTLRRLWTMLAHAQGGLWNAAVLARSLAVDGKTVARYVDLLADLLLVRRLPPFHANLRKRLVRSPKVYVRDSGIVHTLLRLDDPESVLGHPVAGASWEGFVVETLLRAAPERTRASFYRTATGVEIDLILELPGNRMWAVEIKRGFVPAVGRGFRVALDDVNPDRALLVHGGTERYPKGGGIEAIGVRALAEELSR